MNSLKSLLLLHRVPSCNARVLKQLCNAFGDSDAILSADNLRDLAAYSAVGKRVAQRIRHEIASYSFEQEYETLKSKGVEIVTCFDEAYPSLLHEIYDPPIVLYVKGNKKVLSSHAISIVGSRHASMYGRQTAYQLSEDLADYGFCVCSGMARGIDAAAHKGSIRFYGKSMAVLGCGIDIVYPQEHARLYDDIIHNGGILISEYACSIEPRKYNFPQRNRIISGITYGTIVVEAAHRSGSLITARYALEQGRMVYSVPGSAQSTRSIGTNNLIKQGAQLITCAQDVIDDLAMQGIQQKDSCDKNKSEQSDVIYNEHTSDDEIMMCLKNEPLHIDELHEKVSVSSEELHSRLTYLELEKKVCRKFGGVFACV